MKTNLKTIALLGLPVTGVALGILLFKKDWTDFPISKNNMKLIVVGGAVLSIIGIKTLDIK